MENIIDARVEELCTELGITREELRAEIAANAEEAKRLLQRAQVVLQGPVYNTLRSDKAFMQAISKVMAAFPALSTPKGVTVIDVIVALTIAGLED
jgi:hypothetical protein